MKGESLEIGSLCIGHARIGRQVRQQLTVAHIHGGDMPGSIGKQCRYKPSRGSANVHSEHIP
jgi:hypothetical protein